MLCNMKEEILRFSLSEGSVIGFNVFGFEDAQAVIKAAEEVNLPVMLQLNKLAVEYMPIRAWAGLLRPLAERAKVPVSVHLDHCKDFNTVITAIYEGFQSVMYDGSQMPLAENISRTKEIVRIARCFDVAVEGEIGSVPYADIPGAAMDIGTSPEEARQFAIESGVDWMAVAVGQVHRLQSQSCCIQFDCLKAIEACTNLPIVIHGGSGIREADLQKLSKRRIGKMNFGTGLRTAFGETLKESVHKYPDQYDRLILFEDSVEAVRREAVRIMKLVNP